MTRRFHTPKLITGLNPLDARQGKHAHDVLRLEEGAQVELFDDAGTVATGSLVYEGNRAGVRIQTVSESGPTASCAVTVAAAVPKGERADWMVEKLSELGVAVFVPLATDRSVVVPDGTHKLERWQRIATESAKQSRRHGVMRIESVSTIDSILAVPAALHAVICLTTEKDAKPLSDVFVSVQDAQAITLLVGPEGGWTDAELQRFEEANVEFARLTNTILRVETAGVAAAAITMMLMA